LIFQNLKIIYRNPVYLAQFKDKVAKASLEASVRFKEKANSATSGGNPQTANSVPSSSAKESTGHHETTINPLVSQSSLALSHNEGGRPLSNASLTRDFRSHRQDNEAALEEIRHLKDENEMLKEESKQVRNLFPYSYQSNTRSCSLPPTIYLH
jgi:hypothetical protein